MATAVVTGGAGFIGSHLVEALLHRGDTVRVLDNLSTGTLQNLRLALRHTSSELDEAMTQYGRLDVVAGDVRDTAVVRKVVRSADCVYHLASMTAPVPSLRQLRELTAVNIDGTLNVLQAAQAEGVRRVVYASCSSVYGDGGGIPQVETLPVMPRSPYAATKAAGEAYCRAFTASFGLETVVLRYFSVYGPRQHRSEDGALVPSLATALLQRKRPVVNGDGRQTRDLLYVSDAVEACLAAASTPAAPPRPVNVASGLMYSVVELIELLNEILGTRLMAVFAPHVPGEPRESLGSTVYAHESLGFAAQVSLRDGLGLTADFLASRLRGEKAELPCP
jgi:UDP-glucose 4-epimerase